MLSPLNTSSHLMLTTPCIAFIIPMSLIRKVKWKLWNKGFSFKKSAYRESELQHWGQRVLQGHCLLSLISHLGFSYLQTLSQKILQNSVCDNCQASPSRSCRHSAAWHTHSHSLVFLAFSAPSGGFSMVTKPEPGTAPGAACQLLSLSAGDIL